jgi:hypothetical protein
METIDISQLDPQKVADVLREIQEMWACHQERGRPWK